MSIRERLGKTKTWVIKVGSSLVTKEGIGLDLEAIARWVEQIAGLRKKGIAVVLVSSGAVAEGMHRLAWKERPHALHNLQAAAAVGQMGLVQAYESHFQRHGIHTAQILLSHDDLLDRQRYLNARSTLKTLTRLGIVPVVNENDTVAVEEIRFGDNDTLAAMVTNLIEAELMILLTDQDGMYRADPRVDPDATLIRETSASDAALEQMAASGGVGRLGRGGMLTKVKAARRAERSGAATIIASGRSTDVFDKILAGEEVGTLLIPSQLPIAARKQWLASQLRLSGRITLDQGAVEVLRSSGSSLLAVGVTAVDGNFSRGDMVACLDPQGKELARGLVNYSSVEARIIKGHASSEIESLLGYVDEAELIHRDNLVIV